MNYQREAQGCREAADDLRAHGFSVQASELDDLAGKLVAEGRRLDPPKPLPMAGDLFDSREAGGAFDGFTVSSDADGGL
jgi:hypothetical protein